MTYGYARCSTNESRQDVTRQIRELKEMGANDSTIYFEYASGAKKDRVELNKLLDVVKEGDMIVCTEISRLTRSTLHLCEIIEVVKRKEISLRIKDSITIDCISGELEPMTKAFLQISGVFAELERQIIKTRIKSGIANAKIKARLEGREYRKSAKTQYKDISSKYLRYYKQWEDGHINKTELAKLAGVTRATSDKYIKILKRYKSEQKN